MMIGAGEGRPAMPPATPDMPPATNDDATDGLAVGEVSATDSDSRPLEARLRDHASIGRLADDLLPALIAKLGVTALGEIEVREGEWKVRLRRPSDALGPMYGRRATDRPSRSQPGHTGHGHAPGAVEPHRAVREMRDAPSVPGAAGDASAVSGSGSAGGSNGSHHHLTAVGPGPDPGARVGRMGHLPEGDQAVAGTDFARDDSPSRAVATSPAVGIFQARGEARSGSRVRAGDRLASVDVLGVPQPVVAPVDGLVGATLVEHGDPVEYGQELIRIELAVPPAHEGTAPAAPGAESPAAPGAESPAAPGPGSPSSAEAPADPPSHPGPSEPNELVANVVTPRAPGTGGA